MNRFTSRILLAQMLAVIALCGCGKSTTGPSTSGSEFILVGSYVNSNGDNPLFVVNNDLTHSYITFDGEPVVNHYPSQNDVEILLNNISISGGGKNYQIESISAEEHVDGSWRVFAEFDISYKVITEIAVVLCLDVSSSLGSEIANVKNYAKEFASIIVGNGNVAQIGAVAFSTELTHLQFTTSYGTFSSFVDGLSQGQYTRMYDAIYDGITMLQDSISPRDGYALVTFTDGVDNISTHTVADLMEALEGSQIKSYTMGLEGNEEINIQILQNLSVNGEFRIVDNMNDLQAAFSDFAKAISNVYQVKYKRNDQVIQSPRPVRFIFTAVEV